ncbi:MAG: phosphate/phosphite/phosphonate ABC transporter substrate-binding protein [Desulfobacterales bacterium]|nr:phosphate/phosphite/phosphonate ABC transporter substrate-binding protein [Desulfobacterales bacterium]
MILPDVPIAQPEASLRQRSARGGRGHDIPQGDLRLLPASCSIISASSQASAFSSFSAKPTRKSTRFSPREQIDLAFICTGPFAASREKFGFEALATPQVRGQPFYQSYLIVPKDSPYQKLEDLKGRVFAFTDPDSNTGAMVPRFWLAQLGETPESFFSKTIFTYSHDNSILAVAKGLVDAAAVDGHQWEYFERFSPAYTSRTRVIRKSQPFGSPPLVASARLAGRCAIEDSGAPAVHAHRPRRQAHPGEPLDRPLRRPPRGVV